MSLLEEVHFQLGDRVQFYSTKQARWISTTVLRKFPDGTYKLGCKSRAAPGQHLRKNLADAADEAAADDEKPPKSPQRQGAMKRPLPRPTSKRETFWPPADEELGADPDKWTCSQCYEPNALEFDECQFCYAPRFEEPADAELDADADTGQDLEAPPGNWQAPPGVWQVGGEDAEAAEPEPKRPRKRLMPELPEPTQLNKVEQQRMQADISMRAPALNVCVRKLLVGWTSDLEDCVHYVRSTRKCPFGKACTERECPAAHPEGRGVDAPCAFGRRCKRWNCAYLHPEGRDIDTNPTIGMCRNGTACTSPDCMFLHPGKTHPNKQKVLRFQGM